MELNYFTTMRATMKPDTYGGEECDEHIPMWEAYAEGDMDSEHSTEDFILSPKNFPAGTKIIVQEPCCPKCDMNASLCMETDDCDFDWKAWADDEYS